MTFEKWFNELGSKKPLNNSEDIKEMAKSAFAAGMITAKIQEINYLLENKGDV